MIDHEKDRYHLLAALEDAAHVRAFIKETSRGVFRHDIMRRSAVTARLIGMAGHVRCISDDFKGRHSHVPWREVIAMGDALLRKPESLSPDAVWHFAKSFIPEIILKAKLLGRYLDG